MISIDRKRRMKTRLLIILMSLLISIFTCTSILASADTSTSGSSIEVKINNGTGAPGSTIEVPIYFSDINGTVGVNNLDFIVSYDKTKLSLLSVDPGSIATDSSWNFSYNDVKDDNGASIGQINFLYCNEPDYSSAYITNDGIFATMKFHANDADAIDSTTDVKIKSIGAFSYHDDNLTISPVTSLNGIVTINQGQALPAELPSGLTFIDSDNNAGKIMGTIRWTKAADESNITNYELYLLDANGSKLSSIAEVPAGTESYTISSSKDSTGAKYVGIYSKNAVGESVTGLSIELVDLSGTVSVPTALPSNLFFTDTDTAANKVAGTITWVKAADESNITNYQIYLMDQNENRLSFIAEVSAGVQTYTIANSIDCTNAKFIAIYSKNTAGVSISYKKVQLVDNNSTSDTTAPLILSPTTAITTSGGDITVRVNKDAIIYLVPSNILKDNIQITQNALITTAVAANTDTYINISGVENNKTYALYAIDNSGNISEISPVITIKVDECFIATAAYGSKFMPAVKLLRHFRDDYLLTNPLGNKFVNFYYKHSPPIARFIAGNNVLKLIVRILLTPFVAVVYSFYHPVIIILALLALAGTRMKRFLSETL